MPVSEQAPIVVGVDIGTTATKAVAYTADGTAHGSGTAGYPLQEPSPGAAVQDPEILWESVGDAVADAVGQAGDRSVAALAFSSAMHGLLARDGDDEPLTPLLTWADDRGADTARALRADPGAADLHRRTGVPVHPMSPLVKLAWLRRDRPSLHAAAATWGGIKEFVLARAVGVRVTDASCASGTGLRALAGGWDPEALDIAGVTPDHLDRLVDPTDVVGPLRPEVARAWGVPTSTPVVVGAGDGPLANLGVGAVRPGVAACSIGTSGALRLAVDRPEVPPGLFCYLLVDGLWTVGGAVTNGGVVLDWARSVFDAPVAELLDWAAAVPAGADGLLALPHVLAERAPRWEPDGAGALIGLRRVHGPGHIVRALLEAVCLQLRQVLDAMGKAGLAVDEVRATGGFMRSPFSRQLLVDALGRPVTFPEEAEGSAFGAALLGMQAMGLVPSALEPQGRPAGETREPGPDAAVLARRLPLLDRLPDDLAEVLAALR